MQPVIDTSAEFGGRAERRLGRDRIGWLVTTGRDGTPQPNPVWFAWDGKTILVYSAPDQPKLKHIEANPNVALHLDSRSSGDDIVIVTGRAEVDRSAPPVHENPAYVTKYRKEMLRLGLGSPVDMARTYSVAIRIVPRRVRGF